MQDQLITPHVKGHHLTPSERGEIAVLHAQEKSNRKIADRLGINRQTIANEIARGQTDQVEKVNGKLHYYSVYSPETAQIRCQENRQRCRRPLKLSKVQDFITYFTSHFQEDSWSPDAAVGRARAEGLYLPDEMVCTATLYNYIDAQLLEVRNIDLLEKPSRRVKHKANHKFQRMLTGRSIDDRPKRVDSRREFGNFELDTIVGKRNGQESVLMTLIERKTRFQFVRLIDGRDADSVNYAMRAIVKDHGDIIKTVTADNGSEFADLSFVLDGVADVYYAHPYRSSERGTNEAHNRMLRRDFPKGLSLDTVGPQEVAEAGRKINDLPRHILKYQTPTERFVAESAQVRRRAAKASTPTNSPTS